MSQTNHICVSLDFYGIDSHLESRLGPRNSAEYKTSSGGRGGGVAGERGSGGGGQKRTGTADFSEDCTFLLTYLSRRVVYEEIRKDEG